MSRKWVIAVLPLVATLSYPAACLAEPAWLLDVTPGAILASSSANQFDVRGTDNKATEKEETSLMSAIPTISGGARWEKPFGYFDAKGGGGLLLNNRLRAYEMHGIAGVMMEVKQSMMVGPHAGILYFPRPEWWGDADITFNDAVGYMGGLRFTMGDRVSYMLSFDYYNIVFDVDRVNSGWVASKDKLDMSGIAIQFGLRLQF